MTDDEGARIGTAAAARLAELGCCRIEPGLSDIEFDRVERDLGIEFAADHRAFLAAGLPMDGAPERSWPDWRGGAVEQLRAWLQAPIDGVLFDVRHNQWWTQGWGDRPEDPAAALARAQHCLAEVPKLVPVHGHRFLPAGRGTFGHPVLSVWQTDIICYGTDLADYIVIEFDSSASTRSEMPVDPQVTVAFWSDFYCS